MVLPNEDVEFQSLEFFDSSGEFCSENLPIYCTIAFMASRVNGVYKEDSCSVSHNCFTE